MNTLKFFLHFRRMDLKTRPFFNIRLAFGELLELIQSPSFDEFGDLLWFLGINNPWSIRKIIWRDNHSLDIRYSFLMSYKELSTKGTRQVLYKKRLATLNMSSNFKNNLESK